MVERGRIAVVLHHAQRIVDVREHIKAAVLLHFEHLIEIFVQKGIAVQLLVFMEVNIEIVRHGVHRADDHIERMRAHEIVRRRVDMDLSDLDTRKHLDSAVPGRTALFPRLAHAALRVAVLLRRTAAEKVQMVGQTDDVQPGPLAGRDLVVYRLRKVGVRRISGVHMQINTHRFPSFR